MLRGIPEKYQGQLPAAGIHHYRAASAGKGLGKVEALILQLPLHLFAVPVVEELPAEYPPQKGQQARPHKQNDRHYSLGKERVTKQKTERA